VSRTLLQQFDAIDALDKRNFFRFNFENKIQTKMHDESGALYTHDLARVIPFLDTDLHTGRIENVGIDAEFLPYSWLGLETNATYNSRTRDWETANADVYLTKGPWKVAFGQRYVQESSSQSTIDVRLRPNDEWEFRVYDRFELQTGDSDEFQFGVSKAFDCVILDFVYNLRTKADQEDHTFYFMLRLKEFPEVSYDLEQRYDPPKAALREKLPPSSPDYASNSIKP
jgi:hypothetical protein